MPPSRRGGLLWKFRLRRAGSQSLLTDWAGATSPGMEFTSVALSAAEARSLHKVWTGTYSRASMHAKLHPAEPSTASVGTDGGYRTAASSAAARGDSDCWVTDVSDSA